MSTWIAIIYGFLFSLSTALGFTSPNTLLSFVRENGFEHPPEGQEEEACRLMADVDPALANLLRWRTLRDLYLRLPAAAITKFALLYPVNRNGWLQSQFQKILGMAIVAVDSHCHLDKLANRQGSLSFSLSSSAPYHILFAVTNYCFPEQWGKVSSQPEDDRVFLSFGVHPSRAGAENFQRSLMQDLKIYLRGSRVVAIGEIGLDYSPRYNEEDRIRQRLLFRHLLRLGVSLNLPIIVHCRGYDFKEAESDCITIMRKEVPRFHPIHRHCFLGTSEEITEWFSTFPNSVFGITPKVSYQLYRSYMNALPLSHTVIESDAPYIAKSPCHLSPLAALMARAQGCSTEELLGTTASTAIRFYRLPF